MRCPLCQWQTTVGSDQHKPAKAPGPLLCAQCGSRPEDRELTWFLRQLSLPEHGTKLLDIGPSHARLAQARTLFPEVRYTAIDLAEREDGRAFTPGQRFLVMDVTRLAFSDQAFPLILAPFVLAEVRSDYMAMWELHRCLHNDGMAILTEPIFAAKTKRFAEWVGDRSKLPAENQNRPLAWAYGEDFLERLEAAGFFVEQVNLTTLPEGAAAASEFSFREKPELIVGFKYRASLLAFRERLKGERK